MARYHGPVCRFCRREDRKLFLKGRRCFTDKCAFERRPTPPGVQSRFRRKKSDYAEQLREKQKVRRTYGILEKQFRNYVEMAISAQGVTGENLLQLLERRLDNVLHRIGFAESKKQARQLIKHGHFMVNGRKVTIPSYLVSVDDRLEPAAKSVSKVPIHAAKAKSASEVVPEWLERDLEALKGRIIRFPERADIDKDIREALIVEYYSR